MKFDEDVKLAVPSLVNVIASASDSQQSEESYNVRKFELPNPAGKSGGACTTAFLKQQYDNKNGTATTWMEMLDNMHALLKKLGFAQTPTLSSSRKIKSSTPMEIVPPGSGKRRALLIGINYTGQAGELQSCHNDCQNVREFLKSVHNFRDEEMMVLMDDGLHGQPTKENIENGFILLTKYSQPGDVVFVSFSGHGGRTKDLDGDEADGWDSTIFPVDFSATGQIVDDDILKMLVKPMPAGVTTTILIDCCHSGTVVDLPYTFAAGDAKMKRDELFNMDIVTESVRPEPRGPRKREKKSKKSSPTATAPSNNSPPATDESLIRVAAQPEPSKSTVKTAAVEDTKKAPTSVPKSAMVDDELTQKVNTAKTSAIATSSATTVKPKWKATATAKPIPAPVNRPASTTVPVKTSGTESSWKAKQSQTVPSALKVQKAAFESKPLSSQGRKPLRPIVVGGTSTNTAAAASTLAKAEELRQARRLREEAERLREAS